MSESTSAPAPITPNHLARIKHDAQRGIGASSGDTLRLIHWMGRFRSLGWENFAALTKALSCAQDLKYESTAKDDQIAALITDRSALVDAMTEILRVTPLGSEAFGIAALAIGELSVDMDASKGQPA